VIGGIPLASTVINYIGPPDAFHPCALSEQDYHWTNVGLRQNAIAFRIAYSIGQTCAGG